MEYTRESKKKNNTFFFSTTIITDTGTFIIHENEVSPLWITFLLLKIVFVSLNSNVPPLNESMYPCLVKFCWLFDHWATSLLQFLLPCYWHNVYYLFSPMKEGLRGKHYASDEEVTMLRSRDVIHRGPAWFWCIIQVSVSVIIPVLKKKALLFDLPSYVTEHIAY